MRDNNLFKLEEGKLYLILMGILIAILAYFKPLLGFVLALALGLLVYRHFRTIEEKEKKWIDYIEDLSRSFDSATKHAIFNMPFPLVLLREDGKISWYNSEFGKFLDGDQEALNEEIDSFFPEIDVKKILDSKEKLRLDLRHGQEYYRLYYNVVDDKKSTSKPQKILMLYWINDSDYYRAKEDYEAAQIVPCIAHIDNYDEVKNTTPEVNRPSVLAEIDRIMNTYASQNNGFIRKYENDKYLLIFQKEDIDVIEERKFDILDDIREIDRGNTISVTLSMGVGLGGESPFESYEFSKGAIDIALGRGGDQVVMKSRENINFFGGKTKAVEKRNKVKSRVISHALRELIDQSNKVYVMGHKNADMDSFGAAIGIMRAARNRNKECYFVLDYVNPSIKNIYERMEEEEPDYLDYVVSPSQAARHINKHDLLVVVDNHKPTFTAGPELLTKTDKIVLIDHHRRGADFIKDPILIYLEPYASSTCELVTEILSYMSDKLEMTRFDADALLAGITVDTKNFTFQTGVRTFEAASILKRAGADTTNVSQLFRDDFNTFLSKAEVISSAKVIFKVIAIGRLEKELDDSVLIAAQAADDLLKVNNIEASFVMTYSNAKVHISGRSLGEISAQLILEKLGGGGHLTSAGTQIEDVSMDEAEDMLYKAVEEYLAEGDDE